MLNELLECHRCCNDVLVRKHLKRAIRRQVAVQLKDNTSNYPTTEVVQAPNALTLEEVQMLYQGNLKISAIKSVRSRTGMGLKEAKDLVESFQGYIAQ